MTRQVEFVLEFRQFRHDERRRDAFGAASSWWRRGPPRDLPMTRSERISSSDRVTTRMVSFPVGTLLPWMQRPGSTTMGAAMVAAPCRCRYLPRRPMGQASWP